MAPAFQLHHTPVFLGDLAEAFQAGVAGKKYTQLFVITDQQVEKLCLPAFIEKTGLTGTLKICTIPVGETHKTLATCETIWQEMLSARLDRNALVVNLGGGVVGDMGGFCAATWKRGVDFIQAPTTLLAMTDAALGGKLGIDFQGFKNMVGLVQMPQAVLIDPFFLETLPQRELRSGFAEVIKHAVIAGTLQELPLLRNGGFSWQQVLHASIAVKVNIVTADPMEKGVRMLLNFGHTIGHALESFFLKSEAPLMHGEAVAIGMVCESMSMPYGALLAERVFADFSLPVLPEHIFPSVWEWMQQDKKNTSGKVRMALPDVNPYSMKMLEPDQRETYNMLAWYNRMNAAHTTPRI